MDLMAQVQEVGSVEQISTKNGPKDIRRVTILDETGSIPITLWGEDCQKVSFKEKDIVIFSHLLVRNYQGKQLTFTK